MRNEATMLRVQAASGFASIKYIKDELKRIERESKSLLEDAGLHAPANPAFAQFFRNWKQIRKEAQTLDDVRGAVHWLVRMLSKALMPKVVDDARSN